MVKPKPKPKKPSEPPRKAERAKADKHLPLELQEDLGEGTVPSVLKMVSFGTSFTEAD